VSGSPTPGAQAAGGAGTLTRRVLDYDDTLQRLVAEGGDPIDWAPLARFISVDDFQRVGTFLEVQDWGEYTQMLSRWAAATDSFETSLRRISEFGALVYYEIEERHVRGVGVHVINSMTVFEFDRRGKIRRLHVYLQQAP
jgi:hypothetical protein